MARNAPQTTRLYFVCTHRGEAVYHVYKPRNELPFVPISDGIVTLTPCSTKAETFVANHGRIFETTMLQHNDVVRFGKSNVFRYVDPENHQHNLQQHPQTSQQNHQQHLQHPQTFQQKHQQQKQVSQK